MSCSQLISPPRAKKPIIIYRDHLLPSSETFIAAQSAALRRYEPYFVGSRLVSGITLPEQRRYVVNRGGWFGKFREAAHLTLQFDRRLLRQVEQLRPALIHAHFGPDGVTALALRRQLKIPLIVTFHGSDITLDDEYAAKSYYRQRRYLHHRDELKCEASRFIAISKFIERTLVEKGYPADRIIQHYIGIDLTKFRSNESIRREPIVLFVGRLIPVKGCRYLIRAMEKVQTILPDVRLIIIGDGEERPELEDLAHSKLQNCEFLGTRNQSEVKAWLQRARVFSVPSIATASGVQEGLGLVFLEAQAMGVPVASFATGGIPEAVLHEQTGLLTNPADWETLADNVLCLLCREDMWKDYSFRAIRHVQTHFDLHKQAEKLEVIYDSLVREDF